MIIILCIDNANGMMFNNRRLSMDKLLRTHIIDITSNSNLYMNNYSFNQFSNETAHNIIVNDNFLNIAGIKDYCFVENNKLTEYINKIEKIIVYKWNRSYPSDTKLDINLKSNCFKLISTTDFKGSSHNKISEDVYTCEKI